jgi:hypothetical protein
LQILAILIRVLRGVTKQTTKSIPKPRDAQQNPNSKKSTTGIRYGTCIVEEWQRRTVGKVSKNEQRKAKKKEERPPAPHSAITGYGTVNKTPTRQRA